MSDELELTILMPCLNEAATVAACVDAAQQALGDLGVPGEVLVADNGSTDGSRELAAAHGARVVPVAERGYGAALLAGIEAARGRYVVMGDADLSYDFAEAGRYLARLREGYDLVMGNRFEGAIEPGAMPSLHRYVGNPVLSGLGRLFFGSPVGDFHSGMRGFRRDAMTGLHLRTTGMEFASEMIVRASLAKLRIGEVPTTLRPDRRGRPPHLRTWRDGWRHLRFLLLYSPRWLFLYPGAVLALVGLVASAALLPTPRVHTLVYAAMLVIIGFQTIVFAAFTKIFAINEGLLPPDRRLDRVFRVVTLEVGLSLGVVMVAAGIAGSLYALAVWEQTAFGALDASSLAMRIVIVSSSAIALGVQVILSSFFFSILGLRRRL
ncbi:MAG TPA: glycosyltransferase family 2 protein [Candidatus Saccharimonadales bacterium]|nr:glycosyltransferase family 2 protein [Candidatus Saccharimonadales bacterium]